MDFSNVTRLGITSIDPGAIIGQPSPDAFKPIPRLPLTEPIQQPNFSQIMVTNSNDKFVKTDATPENKAAEEKAAEEPKKRNYKKMLGIGSLGILACFGGAKLINLTKKAVKKI